MFSGFIHKLSFNLSEELKGAHSMNVCFSLNTLLVMNKGRGSRTCRGDGDLRKAGVL